MSSSTNTSSGASSRAGGQDSSSRTAGALAGLSTNQPNATEASTTQRPGSALLTPLADQGRHIQLPPGGRGLAAQLSQAPPQVVLLGGGCRKQVAQTLLQRDPAALGPGAQDLDHALLQLANQDLSHVDCSAISYAIKLGLFVRRTLQAFANGLLQDGQLWIDMLEQRNLMAHAYDVKRARQALALIQDRFAPALLDLAADLERQR
ncbi:nucleotidyltransferase substrate binding protein [Synechococcus sp. CBW1004]|nr:nucleotidyltransferase substrate binding protein [Synechococcus sp. CBW1004]